MSRLIRFHIIFFGFVFAAAAPAEEKLPPAAAMDVPLKFTWSSSPGIKQVRGVFPHPTQLQRAVLATASGVLITEDAGRTWTNLPEAAAEKVGLIRDVAFHPLATDTFYLASQTQGIWATTDNGKTFQQLGTKATGMASDTVVSLVSYSGDPAHRTLLAVHGDDAPGMSRSRDDGRTWDVLNTDYCFQKIVGIGGNSKQLHLFGATVQQPDVQNLYSSTTLGEYGIETIRDAVLLDMAVAPADGTTYVTTSDSGLYRIDGKTQDLTKPGSGDDSGWASVAATWGRNAGTSNLFLYDPAKLGLAVSGNELVSFDTTSTGLPVGPLIKEGAVIRPNANGSVVYAVANDGLTIGRTPERLPEISLNRQVFTYTPKEGDSFTDLQAAFYEFSGRRDKNHSAVANAKELIQRFGDLKSTYSQCQLTISARVPVQPKPPVSVTVDLRRFRGSPETEMADDGTRGDATAGDGVYTRTMAFLTRSSRPYPPDGGNPLAVTVTYADGQRGAAVGVVGIYATSRSYCLWDGTREGKLQYSQEGDVTVTTLKNPLPEKREYPSIRIDARKAPWSVTLNGWYNTARDIDGFEVLSFRIKVVDGKPPGELFVRVSDQPDRSAPTMTDPIPVLGEFVREGPIGAEFRQVVIPWGRLLAKSPDFKTRFMTSIVLSCPTGDPVSLVIEDPCVLATANELDATKGVLKR